MGQRCVGVCGTLSVCTHFQHYWQLSSLSRVQTRLHMYHARDANINHLSVRFLLLLGGVQNVLLLQSIAELHWKFHSQG